MRVVGHDVIRGHAAAAALGAVAGCATNPLQNTTFWRMEQCAKFESPAAQLIGANQKTIATVSRASCKAAISAESRIERVMRQRTVA
jgi:hypothetical protein